MSNLSLQPERLEKRLFDNSKFLIGWIGCLMVFEIFVSWPLRNIALVFWVYGSQGYFHEAIRVLPGKPTRFSNGVQVPTLPDLVTGFGSFFITVLGLTFLLIFTLRFYDRHFTNKNSHPV